MNGKDVVNKQIFLTNCRNYISRFGITDFDFNNPEHRKAVLDFSPESAAYLQSELTDEDLKRCIAKNSNVFRNLNKPSEEVCRFAIEIDPYNIDCIKDPSDDLKWLALRKDPYATTTNLTPEMKAYCLSEGTLYVFDDSEINGIFTDEQVKFILSKCPDYLDCLKEPKEEWQFIAIRKDIKSFRFIKNPTYNVAKEVLEKDGEYIRYIQNNPILTKELVDIAFKSNPKALRSIPKEFRTVEMEMEAVKLNPENVRILFIDTIEVIEEAIRRKPMLGINYSGIRLSEDVQLKMVQFKPDCIVVIKDPHDSVLKYVEDFMNAPINELLK